MSREVVNIKRPPWNARGDGVTDDTDAIQGAFDQVGAGRLIRFPSGEYRIRTSLFVRSDTIVRGAGNRTIIRPLDDSGDAAGPIFLLKDVERVTLRAMRLDGNARNLNQNSGHGGIQLVGARHCLVKHVSVVDLGKTAADPGGIHIQITANEATPNPRKLETRESVSSEFNVIESCSFADPSHLCSFGIRFQTYWWSHLPDDGFTAFVRHNVVRGCRIDGFFWNAVEIAGPATRENLITENRVRHAWLVALEADKGAKLNHFVGNRVETTRAHPNPSAPNQQRDVTAMRDQGYAAGHNGNPNPERFAEGNVYRRNVISGTRQLNAGSTGRAAGMLFSRSRGAVFVDNEIRTVTAPQGRQACAVATVDPVEDLIAERNVITGTRSDRCGF